MYCTECCIKLRKIRYAEYGWMRLYNISPWLQEKTAQKRERKIVGKVEKQKIHCVLCKITV